eukprot:scaffold26527_cov69-Phaeocystis_antarctica.AAC.2
MGDGRGCKQFVKPLAVGVALRALLVQLERSLLHSLRRHLGARHRTLLVDTSPSHRRANMRQLDLRLLER